jgi:hypothetical protein
MYGAVKPPNVLEYVLPSQCGWSVAVAFACGFCLWLLLVIVIAIVIVL